MNTVLRSYQEECVARMVWARHIEGGSIISAPTGSGKSLIIAELAKRLNEPILILCPSKEILEQDKDKLEHWTKVSVYSAGSGTKDVGHITIATIQSAYKNPELFAHFKVVIIDEVHLVNVKNLDGMYNQFFQGIGAPKLYGLTATPYRMDAYYKRWGRLAWQCESIHCLKMLCRYRERMWKQMPYVVNTHDLLEQGYLVPLTYHEANLVTQDQLSFNKSKSEFDLDKFEQKFNPFLKTTADLINEIEHKSVLVFTATITQAHNLQSLIPNSAVVTGETPKKEREKLIADFRSGELRVVINVGVLLLGFDKPDLESIVVARPTRSIVLHTQLLGRGMRLAEGKKTCHIYDLVGNVEALGKAESFKVEKIDNLWNVTSDKFPQGLHYFPLYSFQLKPKATYSQASHQEQPSQELPELLNL
jgi:DNA repair protein RadD